MSPLDLKFKLNDTVYLTEAAIEKYGATPNQGMGGPGRVVIATHRIQDPTRPYLVRWESGHINSYQEQDLQYDPSPVVGTDTAFVGGLHHNIIAFPIPSRRTK